MKYKRFHEKNLINDFWQFVYFIDKTYVSFDQFYQKHILNTIKTRFTSKDTKEMSNLYEIKLHFTISILW